MIMLSNIIKSNVTAQCMTWTLNWFLSPTPTSRPTCQHMSTEFFLQTAPYFQNFSVRWPMFRAGYHLEFVFHTSVITWPKCCVGLKEGGSDGLVPVAERPPDSIPSSEFCFEDKYSVLWLKFASLTPPIYLKLDGRGKLWKGRANSARFLKI